MEYFRGIAEYYPDEIHDAVKIKFETSNGKLFYTWFSLLVVRVFTCKLYLIIVYRWWKFSVQLKKLISE